MMGVYYIVFDKEIGKYVIIDSSFKRVAEFEYASDLFEYCDSNDYKYVIL